MNSKKNNYIAYFVILLLLLLVSLGLNIRHYYVRNILPPPLDTIPTYDTLSDNRPKPSDSTMLGYVDAVLPIVRNDEPVQNDTSSVLDTTTAVEDTTSDIKIHGFVDNGIEVGIPITQKIYQTEFYRAVISGYRPSLDSLIIYQKNLIINRPYVKTAREKHWSLEAGANLTFSDFKTGLATIPSIDLALSYEQKRWGIEVAAGYEYSSNSRGFTPFIGARAFVKILSF